MSVSSLSGVPWLSSMVTATLNTPAAASNAVPGAGCAVNTSCGAPAVGTWRETPDAVCHSPPLSEPLPAKNAAADPATRPTTNTGIAIRSARLLMPDCFLLLTRRTALPADKFRPSGVRHRPYSQGRTLQQVT